MTLGDAKRKTLMLLDEYSSGGEITVDEDINAKMNDFFDVAQKDIAQWQAIVRRTTVQLDGTGDQELPSDVARVIRVRKNGVRVRDYEIIDRQLVYESGDTAALVLDYIATPETISPDTDDSYAFEVSEQAANCLPFFVAAQQLIADLVVDYGAFYNLYLQMRGMLPRTIDGVSGGAVAQRLYR